MEIRFGVGYKFNNKLNVNADVVYYGKFYDSDDPENVRPKDRGNYATVSLSANYKFENGFAINARVNNLFDKNMKTMLDIGMELVNIHLLLEDIIQLEQVTLSKN